MLVFGGITMGIFGFLKKKEKIEKNKKEEQIVSNIAISTVSEDEKKFYQPDEYYVIKSHEGTIFEHTVVTFEERKRTTIPSEAGLYVAEILLLEYCSYGIYPKPKNGYPGFWWFEYGIRDIGRALKNLEDRGFIKLTSVRDSVGSLTVPQLKGLLVAHNQTTTGKKADLVERVSKCVSEEELLNAGVVQKYQLTEKGQQELQENAYVPYMHKCPNKTTENDRFGTTFNVWCINKLLGEGDKSNWKDIVDSVERKMNKETEIRNEKFRKDLQKIDPEGYEVLTRQDEQIAAVHAANAKYVEDDDIETYIRFWEKLWEDGGLKFEGSRWHFELPDLYIKVKKYDKALLFLEQLKHNKESYAEKAESYIDRIEKLKVKENKNHK